MIEFGEPNDTFEVGVQTRIAELHVAEAMIHWTENDETDRATLEAEAQRLLEIREDFTTHVGEEAFDAMNKEALDRLLGLRDALEIWG